jgi:tetratricopeptide (TPR) repeat protein
LTELVDSFVDPTRRLSPDAAKGFAEVARRVLSTDTFDLWIHSCVQVSESTRNGSVTDEAMGLCQRVLNIDARSPVALFYCAEGERERGHLEEARLYFEDLTRFWPSLPDGWLGLGRLLHRLRDGERARRSILQARRY